MSFRVSAEAYDRFMGRFSAPLAVAFADLAGIGAGMDVLDVGRGPGALTTRLVEPVGADHVQSFDPMPDFVAAVRERLPGVSASVGPAEGLRQDDDSVDAALA